MNQLKELALAAKGWADQGIHCYNSECTCKADAKEFRDAASPDVVLGLIAKIEVLECALKDSDTEVLKQREQYSELLAENDQLKATVYTDNSETLKNALAEIEQLKHLYRATENEWQNRYDELRAKLAAYECGHRPACEDCAEVKP